MACSQVDRARYHASTAIQPPSTGVFHFTQCSANHSIPIGRASWSGLAQSVFSAPARHSSSINSMCISATRRYAKNALHYVQFPIMCRAQMRRPVRLCAWVSARSATAHNSEVLQELHQLIRGLVPETFRFCRLQPIERTLFHGEVCFDIHVCRCRALVAEPESDHSDIDTGLEQMHSRGVPTMYPET